MTISSEQKVILDHLPKADGSAIYTHAGYTVAATVNGPLEASRRDEDAFQAVVDVIVRPAAGAGGTRERHLESALKSALGHLILLKNFPRQLFQVVLQVTATPENDYVNTKLMQASPNLPIIPALLQAAMLALISGAVPLKTTATAACAAILTEGAEASLDPTPRQIQTCQSVHVFGFTRQGQLLLSESQGGFTQDEWDGAYDAAKKVCIEEHAKEGIDMVLDDDSEPLNLAHLIRTEAEEKVDSDLHWKYA